MRSTSRLPGGSFDLEENEDDDQFDTSQQQQQQERVYDFERASDLTKSTAMMNQFNVKDAARIGKKKNIFFFPADYCPILFNILF